MEGYNRFDPEDQLAALHKPARSGHPVLYGLAWFAGITVLRYYARSYLLRTQGIEAADSFFRRADKRAWRAVFSFAFAFAIAALISYASLATALAVFVLSLIAFAAVILPTGFRIVDYARQELSYRRANGMPDAYRVTR